MTEILIFTPIARVLAILVGERRDIGIYTTIFTKLVGSSFYIDRDLRVRTDKIMFISIEACASLNLAFLFYYPLNTITFLSFTPIALYQIISYMLYITSYIFLPYSICDFFTLDSPRF